VVLRKTDDGGLLEFKRVEILFSGNNGGLNDEKKVVEYYIRGTSTSGDPEKLVRDFVSNAYDMYVDQLRQAGTDDLFLYHPVQRPWPGEDADNPKDDGCIVYKRYRLSSNKTFGTGLFHPEKEAIVRLVDDFMSKTGKFAVPGFPNKLGLFLHGPPGTGKTSLIKALAAHTGRHIVSVPLNKVKTNQDLMNIMYDQDFKVTRRRLHAIESRPIVDSHGADRSWDGPYPSSFPSGRRFSSWRTSTSRATSCSSVPRPSILVRRSPARATSQAGLSWQTPRRCSPNRTPST
jgi:hypothetical protein